MNKLIDTLQRKRLVWHGGLQPLSVNKRSSGYQELDEQLEGGFPEQGVIEVLSSVGIGEFRLLLPSLLADDLKDKFCVFINPPGLINGAMLAASGLRVDRIVVVNTFDHVQGLWASEQCLKSGSCHSVLLWNYQGLAAHQVKRLQLAGEQGHSRVFLMRQTKQESLPLPVDLSLVLTPERQGIKAKVLKRKQGWPTASFDIDMRQFWPELTMQPCANNVVAFPQAKTG